MYDLKVAGGIALPSAVVSWACVASLGRQPHGQSRAVPFQLGSRLGGCLLEERRGRAFEGQGQPGQGIGAAGGQEQSARLGRHAGTSVQRFLVASNDREKKHARFCPTIAGQCRRKRGSRAFSIVTSLLMYKIRIKPSITGYCMAQNR